MTSENKPAARPRKKKHLPGAFLDLPPEACVYETSRAVVLPLPYEESVSYGGGTAKGPDAIIIASQQVELYNEDFDSEPALQFGVHTLAEPEVFNSPAQRKNPAAVLAAIADATSLHAKAGKFIVGLGGEHTVSYGIAKGLASVRGAFALVHIDAHADLRESYEDNPYSHACVVRRIAELPECEAILQLGIRSTSPDQVAFSRQHRPKAGLSPVIKTWTADMMHEDDSWRNKLAKMVKGRKVFFTFDVDGLDPSIIPATGTPEPNGLTWRQLMSAARIVAKNAYSVVAMDCVELAPAKGLHYADFAAARAVYNLMCIFLQK